MRRADSESFVGGILVDSISACWLVPSGRVFQSSFLAIGHAGCGRMPLREAGGKTYADLQDEVELPRGTRTTTKESAIVSFRSVELGAFREPRDRGPDRAEASCISAR